MSNARFVLVVTTIMLATLAVVGLSPILIMVAVLIWAWRRWRRPKATVAPVVLPPEELCHTWGYVIPFAAFVDWTPGYVGITKLAPKQLPDGRVWCPRWDDDDHREKRASGLLDYDRAEVLYVADTWAMGRVWEDATIAQYLELGSPLLNDQGNPHR